MLVSLQKLKMSLIEVNKKRNIVFKNKLATD